MPDLSSLVPIIAASSTAQEIKWLGQTRLRVLADAAATGGQVTLIEEFCGEGDQSPLHVHHDEDEMFWLLEGAMTAWVGDDRHDIAAGGFALLPRGLPHAYRFTAASRALLIATPAGIEEMFREAGWDLATPPPPDWSVSMPKLAEVCERRRTPILGPPPEM